MGGTMRDKKEMIEELLWDYLKKAPEHKDRKQTGWGTKTLEGLYLSLQRIFSSEQTQGEQALKVLEKLIEDWGEAFDDPDEDVSGSDAVEGLSAAVQNAQDVLKLPGFKDVLKREGGAQK